MTYVLADCNNFYASCEALFQPSLRGKPVVVLSNNDGNVIARSPEAKALGIEMCAPAHELRGLFKAKGVRIFSSNYPLYADMSRRVMQTLERFTPDLDVYSIDEAFLRCRPREGQSPTDYAQEIRRTVFRLVGIPVGVGIGPTRTLAKLANKLSKTSDGAMDLSTVDLDALLGETETGKIWGIGPAKATLLAGYGITNARQLRDANDRFVQKYLTVTGYRTVLELRGIPCITFPEPSPARKTFTSSQSFGQAVERLDELRESVAHHTVRAGEKLRKAGLAAGYLEVFVETNEWRKDEPQYSRGRGLRLGIATNYTPRLIVAAHRLLERAYRPGYRYHKAGVTVSRMEKQGEVQLPLFDDVPDLEREAAEMAEADRRKREGGSGAAGPAPSWAMRREHLSPPYTTEWEAFPVAEVEGKER